MPKRANCLRTATGYWLETVFFVFEYIRRGTPPWAAIGNFIDDWQGSTTTNAQRQAMVVDPISDAGADPELQRWAAFCAAMVEELCTKAEIAVPVWTARPEYCLPEPWYLYRGKHPELRAWQEKSSPLPFKRRNIMGGDRILSRA